ncbi:MAG: hypothetical protein WDZ90_02260 [Candidatus Paceibacterota bacterium]
MSLWILLVVIGQFLTASVALVDKYVVTSRTIASPISYAFFVGILSSLTVILFLFSWVEIPFLDVAIPAFVNISVPTIFVAIVALLAGAVFIGAIFSLFSALKTSDASDVIPIVGAGSAIASLLLAFFLLDENLSVNFLWGFALLVVGMLAVSQFRLTYKTTLFAIASGALFGVHFVAIKILFNETLFDNAFFWSRLGIALSALALLIVPSVRQAIFSRRGCVGSAERAGAFVLGNKIVGGVASFFLLKAIELGSVAVVQALGGLQFVFLLVFAAFFGRKLPIDCGEHCRRKDLIQKIVSTSIIVIGVALLFL